MYRIFMLLCCVFLFDCHQETKEKPEHSNSTTALYNTPDILLGDLFEAVQTSNVFLDSKTFVDCRPKISYAEILKHYQSQKSNPDFNVKTFVNTYFDLPNSHETAFVSDTSNSATTHIKRLWPVLKHQGQSNNINNTLIELPNPYIVPGGRFREIYYWDSYFTMLGLVSSKEFDVVADMLDNFAYLIATYGHIPNGNRTYYLSRSQPPFFAQMIDLLGQYKGDSIYENYKGVLREEYEFWMTHNPNKAINKHVVNTKFGAMNRYYDVFNKPRQEAYKEDVKLAQVFTADSLVYKNLRAAAESGWDFSSRWLADGKRLGTTETLNIIPVDLQALMYGMETVLIRSFENEDPEFVAALKTSQANRITFLNAKQYNQTLGVFEDYNFKTQKQTNRLSLAMVYPLYFKMATDEQAESVAKYIKTHFLKPGGVVTTNNETGEQWDAPNGWAPLQWMTVIGLERYGHYDLATTIMERWIALNEKVYKNTGKFVEKYNVEDLSLLAGGGEYALQDGFGWSNGVYLAFKEKLKQRP